ncbi:MAG: glycosyltransferase [Euryarchaeota archaeon]|nr:glycosyltransferase [Euryarchaeota archaeon]
MNKDSLRNVLDVIQFRLELDAPKDWSIMSQIDKLYCKSQKLCKKDSYTIAFIVNGILLYSGGHTSILRLGTYLSEMGHQIYYITYDDSSREQMESNARINLPGYKGTCLESKALNYSYDIGIATIWTSCYHILAHQDNFDYKMYFIQDFEPDFYPHGDLYYLALNTYHFGFHMVSLGQWNKQRIEKIVNSNVDWVDFPVELDYYQMNRRKLQIKDKVMITVYFKTDRKRAPFLLAEQIKYMQRKLKNSGYQVEVNLFGVSKVVKIPNTTNLGKLVPHKLRELYKKSHIGVVASLTNISLVNYEMIASGLPVVDYRDGSAPTFFSEQEMIFVESDIKDLYNKINHYLHHQEDLNLILEKAQEKLEKDNTSWKKSAQQFNSILIKV